MRAATLRAYAAPPAVEERPDPLPAESEDVVLVAVTGAPITPLDVLCSTGTSYFGPPPLPYVPGVQGVGVVRSGPEELRGRRVWFPTTAGMHPGDGSLAQLCAADVADVVALPDGVDDALAAALGLSAVAAWEVLTSRASLAHGEQVVVLGAGGTVGQVAVQAARLLGARRVVAVCRPGAGTERATRAGADAVVRLHRDEEVTELAERLRVECDGPVDVVVDPVAGVPGSAAAVLLGPGGRLVNLGSSAGPSLSVDSATLRSRSAAVLGYTNTSLSPGRRAATLGTVLRHAADGELTVDHVTVPLEDVTTAWADVAAGVATARVVVRPSASAG